MNIPKIISNIPHNIGGKLGKKADTSWIDKIATDIPKDAFTKKTGTSFEFVEQALLRDCAKICIQETRPFPLEQKERLLNQIMMEASKPGNIAKYILFSAKEKITGFATKIFNK